MNNGIFALKEYGRVVIALKEVMDKQGVTRNRLVNLTGLVYSSISTFIVSTALLSSATNATQMQRGQTVKVCPRCIVIRNGAS